MAQICLKVDDEIIVIIITIPKQCIQNYIKKIDRNEIDKFFTGASKDAIENKDDLKLTRLYRNLQQISPVKLEIIITSHNDGLRALFTKLHHFFGPVNDQLSTPVGQELIRHKSGPELVCVNNEPFSIDIIIHTQKNGVIQSDKRVNHRTRKERAISEIKASVQVYPQNCIMDSIPVTILQMKVSKFYGIILIFIIKMVSTMCNGQTTDNQLIIQNENIKVLSKNYFAYLEDHSIYTEIHLEANNIFYANFNAFSDFNNLTHLYLNDNKLKTLAIYAPKLEFLDLSSNELEELDQSFFNDFALLEIFKLSGNQLSSIDWDLKFHQNINQIDLSANRNTFKLDVHIASKSLEILDLNNNTNFDMNLKTPNLKNLDLRFAKPNKNIAEYCNVGKNLQIYYMNGDAVDAYICSEIASEVSAETESSPERRVGCEFSTLKANYGDVIFKADEYRMIYIYFLTLIIITSLLFISNTYFVYYTFFRSTEQKSEYQFLSV